MPISSPSDISGLVLWLDLDSITDADGATLTSTIADSSGSGHTGAAVSGHAPTVKSGTHAVNGHTALAFAGAQAISGTPEICTDDFTILQVFNPSAYSSVDSYQVGGTAELFNTFVTSSAWDMGTTVGVSEFTAGTGYPGNTIVAGGSLALNTWHVAVMERTKSTGLIRTFVDDPSTVAASATGTTASLTDATKWAIGNAASGMSAYFSGEYACCLIYSRVLTATERADAVAWLQARYGTPTPLNGASSHARAATASIAVTGLTASGARHRGATASIALRDRLSGVAARSRGGAASVEVIIGLTAEAGLGWEFNGRTRDAFATITVDDPVAPPPDAHHLIQTAWLTIPAGPTLDANGQPDSAAWRASATSHAGVWGRYRIVVGGVDVSFVRGAQSLVLNESDTEPFGDDTFTVLFPMISPFEQLGVGDLGWLPGTDDDKHTPVTVQKVDPSGARFTRWEGSCDVIVDNYSGNSAGGLQVSFLGLVKTLDQRVTKPRFTSDPVDVGQLIHDLIAYEAKYGWAGHPPAAVLTGTQTAERGGYGDPLATVTIQNLLAEDGNYTIANMRPRGMRLLAKDRTTVHFTLWCGQSGVTHQLQRNLEHGITAIFGEGTDAGTQFWRNTQYPNAPISPPSYPLPSGQFFNPGDSHTGFQPFSDELRTRGYHLTSQDRYLAADEPVVRDFQDDAGITVDGVVGGQTWNAAFSTGLSAHALDAYIRPLAVVSAAEPFLYNGRGGIVGRNPAYTGRTRREKLEQFGTLPKADAKKSAKAELLVIRSSDYFGTVTADNIDPPEMCALDTRSGMNLLFKGHRGVDRLLHVAKTDRNPGMTVGQNRSVTWTASERGDDYVTIAARMQRQRDVVDQSGRIRAPRRSAKISPDFAPWDSESGAGYLKPSAQTAGLWNVYPIPAGERGTIAHVRLVADTACQISAAVFNKRVSANFLANLPGLADPSSGSAGGLDPWQVNARTLTALLTYADQPLMAWATGGPGAMQGYWPNTPAAGATLTGVLDDASSFTFHSAHGVWLFLAVWTSSTCRISGDPAYGYRALFPGAGT